MMRRWTMLAMFALAAPAAAAPPVAVELFTSQGCSSCPPADALAVRLAREPGVVVISRPVTYWDRLGWKDTLARPENTQLQRDYAARGGSAQVFTPQMVVAGGASVVGSREAELRRLLSAAAARQGPTIVVTAGASRQVAISGAVARPAQLVLVALRASVPVAVGRGENGGRQITYTNVVRAERVIGSFAGGRASFTLVPESLRQPGADRYALILRDGPAGAILAARYI